MDDRPGSPPFELNKIEFPPFTPEDYVFDPTLCSCPKPTNVYFSDPPKWEVLKDYANGIYMPEGYVFKDNCPPYELGPLQNLPEGFDFIGDCPPNGLAPKPEPGPEPDEHDICSKYMRTMTSWKATKIKHTPKYKSTDSPAGILLGPLSATTIP
ncbi:hypothetical protein CISIN_1g031798mg [Citrus sinensis]|uniref:Uncharacterized protein n=1 Tax=Citrus sinensis TaxID=2711 RepID=A0A067DKM4_CITSI|nr:hypothetical protein CISIN_1g031798mg [Citrus sinensis]